MLTDVHAHLYHPDWYPSRFQEHLAEEYMRRRGSAPTQDRGATLRSLNALLADPDGSATLRVMDRAGIDRRIVHILDWGVELGEPVLSIREIHKIILGICARYPDRFRGFAGVDPRRPEAIELLQLACDELGAAGLKLHPTSLGWTLSDERVIAMVELAAKRNLPVMVHSGKTMDILSDTNSAPAALMRLAHTCRSAKMIFGHGGWKSWRLFGDIEDLPRNVYFDISGWQERIATDTEALGMDVKGILSKYPGRVRFGSDSPFFGYNLAFSELRWIDFVKERCSEIGPQAETTVFSGLDAA